MEALTKAIFGRKHNRRSNLIKSEQLKDQQIHRRSKHERKVRHNIARRLNSNALTTEITPAASVLDDVWHLFTYGCR